MSYTSSGDKVFWVDEKDGDREYLFLTVHPTPSNLPVDVQAERLAKLLDCLPAVAP